MDRNALKFISETPDTYRVGNYIVLFGGQDLDGEHFTPQTELESKYTKSGSLEIDWEHGTEIDGEAGPGRTDVLGWVDWKTAKKDERGVWVERVLSRSKQYVEWVKDLIDAGIIGTSSEAIAEDVAKTQEGEIVRWPLKRDSLTVQPAEPRMITENALAAIKHLSSEFPELAKLIPKAEEAVEDGAGSDDSKTILQEDITMSDKNTEAEVVEEEVQEEEIDLAEVLEAQKAATLEEAAELVDDAAQKAATAVLEAIQAEPEQKAATFALPKNVKINPQFGTGDPDKDEDFRRWVLTGESRVRKHTRIVSPPRS
jgi:hypothetical protein